MYQIRLLNILVLITLFSFGCSQSRKVTRIQSDQVTDISGHWNDTDSRFTAEAMITDVLSQEWAADFLQQKGHRPTIIVGTIRNKSSEHIPVEAFEKNLERELINSGKVVFVASKSERGEVREERLDQQSYSSEETAKELGRERGADFMLTGTINSIEDAFKGRRVIYYQVNLELINLESNTKIWIGEKKIKKYIEQKKLSWRFQANHNI